MTFSRLRPPLLAGLALVFPMLLAAQQRGISQAFDLERRGNYAAAADAYRSILAARPAEVAALLGLERVLVPLNRGAEILPEVRAALAASPRSGAVFGMALRAWAAAERPDSMRAVAERWGQVAPGDEAPYREWGAAALTRQDRQAAREAYTLGRARLGRPDALAAEMAQLAVSEGDYPGALREWVPAIRRLPGYRVTAVSTLSPAPPDLRPGLLAALSQHSDFQVRRLEAELRVGWGDPLGGLAVLESALPESRAPAIDALRGVLDQLRSQRSQEALLAQARALDAIAQRSNEPAASRIRLEAAQAYSASGDLESARRLLTGLARDDGAPGSVASGAATALLTVLIGDGKLDEAARRLEELRPTLRSDEYQDLRRRIALGWIRDGDLERADAMVGADSSIDGLALHGRIRLYRGELAAALQAFKAAGPYAGDRSEATRRTLLLALLQPIEADSLPALGDALWAIERGDTAAAGKALEDVAGTLPPAKGGAELRLLAGRLAAAEGRSDAAERLYRAAASPEAPGTAPAAELALAELLVRDRRGEDAVALLEHLILTYPESALVPQARRLLDQTRGGVPQT
jgi:thioredoxin-like negative regulator of GroEL